MLSSSEALTAVAGIPFSVFEAGFWDIGDILPVLQEVGPAKSNSGSTEPNQSVVDQRKLRRMISNRESARRSRIKKQRHLDNLQNEVNRLREANRLLADQLRGFMQGSEVFCMENDRLRAETVVLRQRLSDMGRVLGVLRRLEQVASMHVPKLH